MTLKKKQTIFTAAVLLAILAGAGMILHEGGWSVQVECADCGSHTVYVEYETEEEKLEAEKIVSENVLIFTDEVVVKLVFMVCASACDSVNIERDFFSFYKRMNCASLCGIFVELYIVRH